MILGVMSDTHGNRKLMFRAAEALSQEHGATLFFHLGDDYSDSEELTLAGYEVRAVPGLWCEQYGRAPICLRETFAGVPIAAAHADKDIHSEARKARIVLTGHTHRPAIEDRGNALWFNPGHLKGKTSRGQPATYGIIRIEDGEIECSVHDLHGTCVMREAFPVQPARP